MNFFKRLLRILDLDEQFQEYPLASRKEKVVEKPQPKVKKKTVKPKRRKTKKRK